MITDIQIKIPSNIGLATNTALTAVENKTSNVSGLVKKADYNTYINEIENKVADHNHGQGITTPKFHKITAEVFDASIAQASLARKTNFDTKLKSFNQKTCSNKTKHLLVQK